MPRHREPGTNRGRIDMKAEPEWIDRVTLAAKEVGLSLSAYIRMAVNNQMKRNGIKSVSVSETEEKNDVKKNSRRRTRREK